MKSRIQKTVVRRKNEKQNTEDSSQELEGRRNNQAILSEIFR